MAGRRRPATADLRRPARRPGPTAGPIRPRRARTRRRAARPGLRRRRRPPWIPDLAADTASLRSRAAARIGLHVAVGVPLCTGGHILGALCVYGDRVEDPEDTLIALLTGLAAQVGQYLERRRAEELAVELARTKDEFLAMVTHELRNPLAVITSTAALFDEELDDLTDDEQRDYLHIITRSAERLSVMAEDLLDLARLESGHLAINPPPTDLCAIIARAVHAAAATPPTTNSSPSPSSSPSASTCTPTRTGCARSPTTCFATPSSTPPPAAPSPSPPATDDTDDSTITWTVADTGIGIPAAERPRLFRRFYRASTALDRRIPGTGLGLVITRTIIERHHGTITLADHRGPGTTFIIQLPTKAPPPDTCPPGKPSPLLPNGGGCSGAVPVRPHADRCRWLPP